MRNRDAQKALQTKNLQEVISLSEEKLISILRGRTSLPEKFVATVALELYKRRVPNKQDAQHEGNSITMIKIVKNHLPGEPDNDAIDITPVEKAADVFLQTEADKLNAKLEATRKARYSINKVNKGTRS